MWLGYITSRKNTKRIRKLHCVSLLLKKGVKKLRENFFQLHLYDQHIKVIQNNVSSNLNIQRKLLNIKEDVAE